MARKDRCIYCGVKIYHGRDMCENCREKLKLIRKIRGIVFAMKRGAEMGAWNEKR